MGLLDSLLGSFSGAGGQGQSSLAMVALQLIQQEGGLPGIISKFQQAGMAAQAHSWVGNGANQTITGSTNAATAIAKSGVSRPSGSSSHAR